MDSDVSTLAERQHGLIGKAQAIRLGVTRSAIQHRLHSGRWELVGPGVYRLPGSARTWDQRLMAATLAAGPGAVASHRSAAALLGIPGFSRHGHVDITTPRERRSRRPDALMHRSLWLPASHVCVIEGVPITRVARTLVDLAGTLPEGRTERAIDNCLSNGAVTIQALHVVAAELARPGRPGTRLIRRLLAERGEGYVAPASELEALFLAVIRAAGMEEPVRQLDVGDDAGWVGRVDYAYPHLLLLAELDSRRHHMSKLDFESDRARDNRRAAAGWRTLRITWHMLTAGPADVIAVLRRSGVTSHRQGDVK